MYVPYILKNRWVQTSIISGTTFAVGYLLGKRNGDVYEVILGDDENEVAPSNQPSLFDVVDDFVEKYVTDTPIEEVLEPVIITKERARIDYSTPVNKAEEKVSDIMSEPTEPFALTTNPPTSKKNVFDRTPDEWDEDLEVSLRDRSKPYIIHADEFTADVRDYKQETITYYAGDDIMADQADTPIYNFQKLMGELRFGHGSPSSKDIVYIRNEKEEREWEIIRHSGRYEVEVLGNEIEAEYAEQDERNSAVRKFRED